MSTASSPPARGGSATLEALPSPVPGRDGWPWTEATAPLPAVRTDGRAWPRVSIVVPSFNQGGYIEETLRSILLQGYPDLELIVIDGGSRDDTVEVLQRYDAWIDFWVSEPDRGQTHAINKGLARATGEIFAYLNSDDLYTPGALHRVVEAFEADPGVDVVHGECIYISEDGRELFGRTGRATDLVQYLRIWDRFAAHDFLTQPEVFCRTRSVRDAGGFREELRSVMDFEMWLRLLERGCRFQQIDAPLAKFRTYVQQKSSVDPGLELCGVVEEYAARLSGPDADRLRAEIGRELTVAKAHLLVRAAIAAGMMERYSRTVRYCAHAAVVHPPVAATYAFWAALAAPVKKLLPAGWASAVRRRLNP